MELKSTEDLELLFISGRFMEIDLPDKRYLLKYFRTPLQKNILQYYLVFGSLKNFLDHTGYACNPWWLRDLRKKIIKLEEARTAAKKAMDLEKLALIETGRYAKRYWKPKKDKGTTK